MLPGAVCKVGLRSATGVGLSARGAPTARRRARRCGAAVNMKPFYDLVAEGTDPTAAWERTRPRIARDALYATWKRDFVAGGIGGGSGSFCSMHRIRCARSAMPPLDWAAPCGEAVTQYSMSLAIHYGGKLFDQPGKAAAPRASAVGCMSCWLQGRRLKAPVHALFRRIDEPSSRLQPGHLQRPRQTPESRRWARRRGAAPERGARRPRRRMLREADSMVTRARMFEHKPDGDVNIFMLQARGARARGVARRPQGAGISGAGAAGAADARRPLCAKSRIATPVEPFWWCGGAGSRARLARIVCALCCGPAAAARAGGAPRGAGRAGRAGGAVPGPAALPARHQVPDAGCAAGGASS
jgi:hypothetical protein